MYFPGRVEGIFYGKYFSRGVFSDGWSIFRVCYFPMGYFPGDNRQGGKRQGGTSITLNINRRFEPG